MALSLLDIIKKGLSQTLATGSSTASKALSAINAPRIGPNGTSITASLANWGGANKNNNQTYSPFTLVKPAYASDGSNGSTQNNSTATVKRNVSADGGYYDANGNFTPYFPGTTTPDTTKTRIVTDNGGNGDGGGEPTYDEQGNLVDEATAEYNRKKNAILSRLQMMKDEAQRLRGQAKGQWDFTTGEVKKNYDALKTLSKEKLQQALEGLSLEDTNVQNTYGRVAGNARRAMESALTRNRMLHRAMGSLGSSFYSNAQGDTTNQGMNTVNDTAIEEAAKRGAIGTAKSKTNTDFAQNDLAIGAEETQFNNDAMKEYNDAIANADMLEKNYNIDSTEAIDEADAKLTSSLEAIKKYVQDKTLATKAGGATTGALGNFVKSYDAVTPIKPVLDNTEKYQGANNFIANANKVGTVGGGFNNLIASASNNLDQYNPNSPNYFLKPKKKSVQDPNQYYINPTA